MREKSIKDPVHGSITVSQAMRELLDLRAVQRLRHVRQLGFSYLVYPGANHTRFEHSLGTMHLAAKAASHLSLSDEEFTLVTSSALLHDIGHGPYSHSIELLIEEKLGTQHTYIKPLLHDPFVQDALCALDLDAREIDAMISGTHQLAEILHGDIDVDRMDYLRRDAHYTGVPYGTVDCERLIHSLQLGDDGLVLEESGIHAAESLIIARTLMRPSVYFHHVSRIAEKMFQHAVWCAMQEDISSAEVFARLDDAACMQTLLCSKESIISTLADQLYSRNLYKRALYVRRDELYSHEWGEKSYLSERKYAEIIADIAHVSPEQVLVDIPEFPGDMQMNVLVQKGYAAVPLEELSPLIATLNQTRRSQWRLGVYAPRELSRKVTAAACEIFHLKQPTTQERLLSA
ncbi:MAG: HD domain-containing protein [Methanomicrobiales archaeon]|jgi:HD superfamily phosphohydrolase|nr:HD domain-containing protein [Methanomicrobiales archaeon]